VIDLGIYGYNYKNQSIIIQKVEGQVRKTITINLRWCSVWLWNLNSIMSNFQIKCL